jgi:hypothetical protein
MTIHLSIDEKIIEALGTNKDFSSMDMFIGSQYGTPVYIRMLITLLKKNTMHQVESSHHPLLQP